MPSKKIAILSIISIAVIISIAYIDNAYIKSYTSQFDDYTLYSKLLAEERKIFVRLPESYDANKAYPLIIKTDGNFNLTRWHNTLATYARDGVVDNSILVSIPNQFWSDTRNRDLVPPYARKDVNIDARPESQSNPELFGRADKFLAFIEKELLPYLESNYNLTDNRVLTGFSAGGSFTLYTLSTKPELFTGYFVFSPAAWYDDSVVVTEFSKALTEIDGEGKFLYLSLGAEENPIIAGSFKGLLASLEKNKTNKLTWRFSYSENAGHNENPYISVPKALSEYYMFIQSKSGLVSN